MEACRDELPQGGTPPQMTDEQRAAMEEQRTKLTACLKKAGVTLPQGGRGGGPGGGPGGGQQLDAKSQEAFEACREEVGATGGPGAAPPGGGAPPQQ